MIKILKGLFMPFMKRKKLIKSIRINSEYMDAGVYIFDLNLTYLVKNEADTIIKAQELFHDKFLYDKNKIMTFIRKLLSKGRVRIKGDSKNKGTVMLLTNSENIKIFDFTNKVVLTKFLELDNYEHTLNNIKYFSNFFNVPKIIAVNKDDLIIEETFINYTQTSKLSQNNKHVLILTVLKDYLEYFKKIKSNPENLFNIRVISKGTWLELDTKMLDEQLPFTKMMGDLMYKNIMFSNNEYYYIDFEVAGENFFLYDFFTFIFFAYLNNNEDYYLVQYFNGFYDEILNEMFEIFNIKYNELLKKEYFNIFINERINYEKNYLFKFDENIYINKYYEIINKISIN